MIKHSLFFFIVSCMLIMHTSCSIKKEKYNILFIAIDDLRPELECYGNEHVKTPHITKFASASTVFTNAYCQVSWCSPSRTSLLTGLRPDHTKVYDLKTHFRSALPNVKTLPQYFKENGYYTIAFGKVYHNDLALQDSLSWNEPCWFPPSTDDPIYAYAEASNREITIQRGKPFAYPTESASVNDEAYPDGKIRAEAIEKLKTLKDKPFFMAVGFYKPHLPYNAPKKYFDLYNVKDFQLPPDTEPFGAPRYALRNNSEEKNYLNVGTRPYSDSLKRALMHGYYACTSYIDEQVGQIINALHELNLHEKTIIVLWGDHGYKLGEYGHWSKHSNFDVDTKVPLIIYHPARTGKAKNMIVESLDIYPTLCEMAGLPVPQGLDGVSLFDNSPKSSMTKDFAISQLQRDTIMGYSMRWNNFRYTQWINMKNRNIEAEELYNHENDPGEINNLSNDDTLSEIKNKLAQKLSPYIRFDQ